MNGDGQRTPSRGKSDEPPYTEVVISKHRVLPDPYTSFTPFRPRSHLPLDLPQTHSEVVELSAVRTECRETIEKNNEETDAIVQIFKESALTHPLYFDFESYRYQVRLVRKNVAEYQEEMRKSVEKYNELCTVLKAKKKQSSAFIFDRAQLGVQNQKDTIARLTKLSDFKSRLEEYDQLQNDRLAERRALEAERKLLLLQVQ